MSTNLVKKLPADYQEVLVANEMELEEKISVEVLRKLVYLYTRGMQYYDLAHKEKFRKFYSDKLVSLLTRKDIIDFLDKNPINFDEKTDLDKLFPAEEEEIILPKNAKKRDSYIKVINNSRQLANQIRRNSVGLIKNQMSNNDISLLVKQKIMQVSIKLNKIDQAMTNEIVSQMTEFDTKKRNKKTKKNYIIDEENMTEEKIESIRKNSMKKDEENSNKSDSNSDEENENINSITDNKDEMNKLLQQMNPGLKNLIGNNPMLREIEEFVQKNMDEMYKSFEELKASFQEEINEAEENGFPDIAAGLKEDLENELENLKDQYEEQRRVETEKIKKKYSNRNSVLVVS